MEPLTPQQERVLAAVGEFARAGRAPSLAEVAGAVGLRSRGSLHKHVQALVARGYLIAPAGRHRGLRLTTRAEAAMAAAEADAAPPPETTAEQWLTLPLLGRIAAGRPLEAVAEPTPVAVPPALCGDGDCYVLEVRGDSLVDAGILDGDYVVIESRSHARNGEIVVALIDNSEATLKRIEQTPDGVWLHAENPAHSPFRVEPDDMAIQGVLAGLMRRYR